MTWRLYKMNMAKPEMNKAVFFMTMAPYMTLPNSICGAVVQFGGNLITLITLIIFFLYTLTFYTLYMSQKLWLPHIYISSWPKKNDCAPNCYDSGPYIWLCYFYFLTTSFFFMPTSLRFCVCSYKLGWPWLNRSWLCHKKNVIAIFGYHCVHK